MQRTLAAAILIAFASTCLSQTITGDILGSVTDSSGGAISDAKVTVRNIGTNAAKETATNVRGVFRVSLLPPGEYEVVVEKAGFAKYQQGRFTLIVNQAAELKVALSVASISETITVNTAPPLINTTNAEISTHFDSKRIADLPLSTNRNILNLAGSVPGVAQVSAGNSNFGSTGSQGTESTGLSYSANGMRQRSNAFIIDGQDSYYASTGGLLQPLNNPDIVSEVRLITSQFLPEFGRAGGSMILKPAVRAA